MTFIIVFKNMNCFKSELRLQEEGRLGRVKKLPSHVRKSFHRKSPGELSFLELWHLPEVNEFGEKV
jgi:hypothetical protein